MEITVPRCNLNALRVLECIQTHDIIFSDAYRRWNKTDYVNTYEVDEVCEEYERGALQCHSMPIWISGYIVSEFVRLYDEGSISESEVEKYTHNCLMHNPSFGNSMDHNCTGG